MSSSLYTQLPLAHPDRQIRLLRPEPPSPDHDDPIFSLAVHDFDENSYPQYIAISYTWGLPVPLLPIVVNGHKVKVHLNCWYALWQMRYHGYTNENFWIDSICINQCDNHEKAVQVSMMGAIFSSAQWVASCVGTGDKIGSLRKILEAGDSRAIVKAGGELDELPYFERVWILQEMFLARDITLFSGVDKLSWEEFSRMSYTGKTIRASCSSQKSLDTGETTTQQTRFSPPAKWSTFTNMAVHYKEAKATDPKDKIYALLPLLLKDDIVRQKLPIVYGKGTSVSLLRSLSVLVHSGYRDMNAIKKNSIIHMVAAWLQDDLGENPMSYISIESPFSGRQAKKDDGHVELNIQNLRMIHGPSLHTKDKFSVVRVSAMGATPSDIISSFPNDWSIRYQSLLDSPPDFKRLKILYNHDPVQGIQIMFYVDAEVRPGDVIVSFPWGREKAHKLNPLLLWDSDEDGFNASLHAHAVLRPTHVGNEEAAGERLLHQDGERKLPSTPVYVLRSWAVPAGRGEDILAGPNLKVMGRCCHLELYTPSAIYSRHMDAHKRRVYWGAILRFKLHHQDNLNLSLLNDYPVHSLLHPLTENTVAWTSSMSFLVEEADVEETDNRSGPPDVASLLKKDEKCMESDWEFISKMSRQDSRWQYKSKTDDLWEEYFGSGRGFAE